MELKEYWDVLEKSLIEFDKDNAVKAKDDKDAKSYQQIRTFIESMLKLGMDIEKTSLLFKAAKAFKLQSLPEETFGKDRVPTTLPGPLSVDFAERVYLPNLKRIADVTMDGQNPIVKAASDLPKQKVDALVLIAKLEEAIRDYKDRPASTLAGVSMFSVSKDRLDDASPGENTLEKTSGK